MRPKLDGDVHQIGAADASNYGPVGGGPRNPNRFDRVLRWSIWRAARHGSDGSLKSGRTALAVCKKQGGLMSCRSKTVGSERTEEFDTAIHLMAL